MYTLRCLSQRGAVLVQALPAGNVNPKFLLSVLNKIPVNHMGGAASIYKLFTQDDNIAFLKRHPPKALRVCTTGGEALPLTASQRWQEVSGCVQQHLLSICFNGADLYCATGSRSTKAMARRKRPCFYAIFHSLPTECGRDRWASQCLGYRWHALCVSKHNSIVASFTS
jgi:hypothetical protein